MYRNITVSDNAGVSDDQHRGPGRPRRAEVDARIRDATLALLRERGPGAVSVASVAERSGIARTTIYRRYDDREALLADALGQLASRGAPADHLDLAGRVEWLLARTAEVLDQGIGPGGVAAVLTGSDPDFAAALRRALEEGLAPVVSQVRRDRRTGLLGTDASAETVIDLVLGAHLAARLRRGRADAAWRRRTAVALGKLLG